MLWVADTGFGRVLGIPVTKARGLGSNHATATVVIGRQSAIQFSNTPDCTNGTELQAPGDATINPYTGQLFVADAGCSVVRWFDPPFHTGMKESGHIGVPTNNPHWADGTVFNSALCEYGDSDANGQPANAVASGLIPASAGNLCFPVDIHFEDDTFCAGCRGMFVSDFGYNRVTHYGSTTGYFQTGQQADAVLGQTDLSGWQVNQGNGDNQPSATSLNRPSAAIPEWDYTSSGQRGNWMHLYVADYGNGRVLVYDWYGGTNVGAAESVIGEPGPTTMQLSGFPNNTGNDGYPWCFAGFSPGGLCAPAALAFTSQGNLLVADWGGNVVRQYGPPMFPGGGQDFSRNQFNGLASWGQSSNFTNDPVERESGCPGLNCSEWAMPTAINVLNPAGIAVDY